MATVPFQTCSSLNFQSLKKTAAASGPIACATGPTCGACGANGALWLSWPALFQISPSCCFPFNDVTSESSYTLLGCCREDFRRCSWVLIGICKVHWPDLLKKSYWAFCEPFFLSPPYLFSTYTSQGHTSQDIICLASAVRHCAIHFAPPCAELPVISVAVLSM